MAAMHEMNDSPFTEAIGRICNDLDIKAKVVPFVQVPSFTATEAHGAVESKKIKTERGVHPQSSTFFGSLIFLRLCPRKIESSNL